MNNGTSNKVRGVTLSGAFAALLASIANFKTWEEFIVWAATSAGAGVLLWGIVELVKAAVKNASNGKKELNSDVSFYLAQALALAIPIGAYSLELWFGWATWGIAGLVASITVAYQLSQTIHWEKADTEAPPIEGEHEHTPGAGPLTQPTPLDDPARYTKGGQGGIV